VAYAVEITRPAARQLASLPRDIQQQIRRRIDGLAENPRPPQSKLLHGGDRIHRLRSGEYRVLYVVDDNKKLVTIVSVGNRKDIYRR